MVAADGDGQGRRTACREAVSGVFKGTPELEGAGRAVLAFSALIAVVTALLFGLVPALGASRTRLGEALKESVRGTGGRRGMQGTRSTLVAAERLR